MPNYLRSLVHGAVSVVLFAIPLALASHSPMLDLTLGGVLNMVYHFLVGYEAEA
jgi:hypothetical protein